MIYSRTESATVARLNRKLAAQGEHVRTCRENSRDFWELGRFYVVNDRNMVTAKDIDPERWLAELEAA